MKKTLTIICAATALVGVAQSKDEFIRRQAYSEMQRVAGQVDMLQESVEGLNSRINKLERGESSESAILKAEIASLKSSIAALRNEMQNMRGEIVKDLSRKIAATQAQDRERERREQARSVPRVVSGKEYVVASGDTLTVISQAFSVPINRIKEANNLKNDNLRIGQKLIIPQK